MQGTHLEDQQGFNVCESKAVLENGKGKCLLDFLKTQTE